MKKFIEFIRNLFHIPKTPSYKRTINLLILVIITLTIPLTLSLLKQKTNTQQLAASCSCYYNLSGDPTQCGGGTQYNTGGGCIGANCVGCTWGGSGCASQTYCSESALPPGPYACKHCNYTDTSTNPPSCKIGSCLNTYLDCSDNVNCGYQDNQGQTCGNGGSCSTATNTPIPTTGTCATTCWYPEPDSAGPNFQNCPLGTRYVSSNGCSGAGCSPCWGTCATFSCTQPGGSGNVNVDLSNYPKNGNYGFGIHWSALLGSFDSASDATNNICRLKSMGINWIKILTDGGSSVGFANAMKSQGIEPIVRLYRPQPNPGTLRQVDLDAIDVFKSVGVRYFESNNEPNLQSEWSQSIPDCKTAAEQTMRNWVVDALHIQQKGVWPVFPALAPGGECTPKNTSDLVSLGYSLDWLKNNQCQLVNGTGPCIMLFDANSSGGHPAAMSIHNYDYNHDNPTFYTGSDGNGFLKFQAFNNVLNQKLGLDGKIAILSTEGGTYIGSCEGGTTSPYQCETAAMMGDLYKRIADYQFSNTTSYYYTSAIWIAMPNADGSHPEWIPYAWWNADSSLSPHIPEIINALQSWAAGKGIAPANCAVTPIPTVPPLPSGGLSPTTAPAPTGTGQQVGGNACPSGITITNGQLTLTIPPNALSSCQTITTTSTTSNPSVNVTRYSPVYQLSPSGTTFNVPFSVSLSFSGSVTNPQVYWSDDGTTWTTISATVSGNSITAYNNHFSYVFVGSASASGPQPTITPIPTYPPYPQTSTRGIFGFAWTGIVPANIPIGTNVLTNILNFIIGFLIVIGVVAALLFLIYAGIKFITAGGDREKIASAQKALIYGIVGLLVIIISFALIRLIGAVLNISLLANFP